MRKAEEKMVAVVEKANMVEENGFGWEGDEWITGGDGHSDVDRREMMLARDGVDSLFDFGQTNHGHPTKCGQ